MPDVFHSYKDDDDSDASSCASDGSEDDDDDFEQASMSSSQKVPKSSASTGKRKSTSARSKAAASGESARERYVPDAGASKGDTGTESSEDSDLDLPPKKKTTRGQATKNPGQARRRSKAVQEGKDEEPVNEGDSLFGNSPTPCRNKARSVELIQQNYGENSLTLSLGYCF